MPEQANYIQNYVTAFETALSSDNFKDPLTGYEAYINVDSFVDFMIMMEITRNVDGYRLSTFLYKDKESKGGKLYLGPIWDFNLAFGNANYCEGWATDGWAFNFNNICSGDFWLNPFWWEKLMQDTKFNSRLQTRWIELRNGPFQTNQIMSTIDSLSSLLEESQQRNFERWPILGEHIWPNSFVGESYGSEVQFVKEWLTDRLEWMDENLLLITATDSQSESLNTHGPNPYPNPFTNQINLTAAPGSRITIFDPLGRTVYENLSSTGIIIWSALNQQGQELSPGLYFYKINLPDGQTHSGQIIKQ